MKSPPAGSHGLKNTEYADMFFWSLCWDEWNKQSKWWCFGCDKFQYAAGGRYGRLNDAEEKNTWFCSGCWERWSTDYDGNGPCYLQITSPLTDCVKCSPVRSSVKSFRVNIHCPCCWRPCEASLVDAPPASREPTISKSQGRFAYVIALWGQGLAWVLGAAVLGKSLRDTGTCYEMVCMCTEDVEEEPHCSFLRSAGWRIHRVQYLDASDRLFYGRKDYNRFRYVFTKLHAMGLREYEKVLLLDIDTLAIQHIDCLFDLQAPAAMCRGMNNGLLSQHGKCIDGRFFFRREDDNVWPWGQAGGINAGVILLAPDLDIYKRMRSAVLSDEHPAHIAGAGPEQDFFSRFWADAPFTHIGVIFNFQLHQMFNALSPAYQGEPERIHILEKQSDIKLAHFSGELKPWHRHLRNKFKHLANADFALSMAEETWAYRLFIKKDPAAWKSIQGYEEHQGVKLTDGLFYILNDAAEWVAAESSAVDDKAMGLLEFCVAHWERCYFRFFRELTKELQWTLSRILCQEAVVQGERGEQQEWQPGQYLRTDHCRIAWCRYLQRLDHCRIAWWRFSRFEPCWFCTAR